MGKISVVITCYNLGQYLGECIDSIQLEKYSERFEVIIVNDGSTQPETLKVLNEFEVSHRQLNIKVIHQNNAGLASARNTGIQNSSGSYILILDADNKIIPEVFLEAAVVMESNEKIGAVYTDVIKFGEIDRKWKVGAFNLNDMLFVNHIDACALFRRNIFDELGGYDKNMPRMGWEDWEFWIRLYANNKLIYYLSKFGFYYRVRKNSMLLSDNDDGTEVSRKYIFAKYPQLAAENFANFYTAVKKKNKYVQKLLGAAKLMKN